MRVLHIVDRDAERVVLETADGLEQFELPVDQAVRDAIEPRDPAPAAATPAVPSDQPRLSPREIQTRVRAGANPHDLAESGDLGWVMRFAEPVLAERERVTDEARRAKARRSTTEGQTVVFGEAVDARFAAHGIDPATVRWDAHRREDGHWLVTARWVGGEDEHEAVWSFHLAARTVAPTDEAAADLLSDRPVRPIEVPPPNLTLAPPLDPELAAFPAMPDAHTGPLPRAEEVFDQAQYDEEPLPLHVPEQTGTGRIPKVSRREPRPNVPSWDDILLGVRRKQD